MSVIDREEAMETKEPGVGMSVEDPNSEFAIFTRGKAGRGWSQQIFRALMTPQQREAYEAAIAPELPQPVESKSIGGASPASDDAPEIIMTREPFPGFRGFYGFLFRAAYWCCLGIGGLFGRRSAPPPNRPLRVLRMPSLISQGGVAKVCLQSMLPIDAAKVHYTLLPFGEKKGWAPELETRPDFEVVQRKILLWPGSYHPRLFRNIIKLARIIRRSKADLIHLHEPQFAPAVRMAAALAGGVPVCVHLHNDYNERRQSMRGHFVSPTMHALRTSHLIACSQTILQAAKVWIGETRYPIQLIEDGSDDIYVDQIDDGLGERLERAAAGRPVVAMMAHLVPHKRIEDFINGCRILLDEGNELFVLLMCYGKERHGRRMRKRFNARFEAHEGEFLYQVKNPQRLMPHISIGASTSVLEGLGLNVLEYQVQGVPVVCTDLLPHREMVTDGETGLLFPPWDVAEFLRAMRRVLRDEHLARQLGEAGRAAALQRTWKNTAEQTAAYYRDILDANRN